MCGVLRACVSLTSLWLSGICVTRDTLTGGPWKQVLPHRGAIQETGIVWLEFPISGQPNTNQLPSDMPMWHRADGDLHKSALVSAAVPSSPSAAELVAVN